MSLLNPNALQQPLFVPQAMLLYTFTTGELESLKLKFQNAETQILNNPKQGQQSLLQMSSAEILTLLKMIDMTYLQGLSGSGVLPALSSHEVSVSTTNGKQPPGTYVCRKCHIPGHFIQNCPNSNGTTVQKNQNGPPLNYVCRKCNIGGHWIQDCPMNQQDYNKSPPDNYICHRCGTRGHWIKSCPTNGNPSYDNKHHMSTSQENNNNNNNNDTN